MKIFKLFCLLLVVSIGSANSQVRWAYTATGFYQIAVGTNPKNRYFGEARILAGDEYNSFFSMEAIGKVNIKCSDWHDISGGLMLGYHGALDRARVGLPFLMAIKPIEAHRNFAVRFEATPMYAYDIALRRAFGIRYTIGN